MTVLSIDDLTEADRSAGLRCLAQRWTDLLLDFESGPEPVGYDLSLTLLAAPVRLLAHPLLSPATCVDLMTGLAHDLAKLARFELFGSWEAEDDDSLGARSEDERRELLTRDVDWALFRLLYATEPCVDCVRTREVERWQPTQAHEVRCTGHAQVRRESLGLTGQVHVLSARRLPPRPRPISARAFALLNLGEDR